MANDTAKCAMRINTDSARFAIDEARAEYFSDYAVGSHLAMPRRGNPT